jgi:outer membrane protein assembly factor BamB
MKILNLTLLISLFIIDLYSQPIQFRGANRDGSYPDKGLLESWPAGGPDKILQIEGFGIGHSSAIVYKNIIFVSGKKDSLDVVSAFDMNGKKVWETVIGNAWYASYSDTRNTPTIENNSLYIASGMGEVVCLNVENGQIIWKKNPHETFKGQFGSWGFAESLLLTENGVIVSVGGSEASIVALSRENGEVLWKSPSTGERRAYVTPILLERNGQQLVIAILSESIFGLDATSGEIYWTYNMVKNHPADSPRSRRNNTNSALYRNGEFFVTSGYDAVALMFSLAPDGRSISLKWTSDVLDTHHGGVVEVDGYIYGSNWHSNNHGNWVCLDWNTGEVKYETEWINKGQIIYADGHLYCKEEKTGNVALVPATPKEFKVVSSFRLDEKQGPYWSHPSIYNGLLFIRQGDVLRVYRLLGY